MLWPSKHDYNPKLNRIWALLDKHVKQHLPPYSDTWCEHFIFVHFVTHFTGLSDMIICAQEICHSFGTSPESFEALAATIQYVQEYQNPQRRWGTLSSYGNLCKGPWLSRARLCRSCASLWAGDMFVSLRTLFLTQNNTKEICHNPTVSEAFGISVWIPQKNCLHASNDLSRVHGLQSCVHERDVPVERAFLLYLEKLSGKSKQPHHVLDSQTHQEPWALSSITSQRLVPIVSLIKPQILVIAGLILKNIEAFCTSNTI